MVNVPIHVALPVHTCVVYIVRAFANCLFKFAKSCAGPVDGEVALVRSLAA
jgi:hypothetical protein